MMKVKNLFLDLKSISVSVLILLLSAFNSTAQNIGISETGATPDNSALLDLNSTKKGFLITRADTADISNPAFGLMTLAPKDSCLYMHNGETTGKKWVSVGGVGHDCSCGNATVTPPNSFTCGDNFTDSRDSKTYSTVEIKGQCWMAENLAYLPSVVGPGTGSTSSKYYYVHGYDGTDVTTAKNQPNYSTYGVLYNWPAAMDGASASNANPSGVQGACPSGWHLPSDVEWCEMENAVEANTDATCSSTAYRGTNTGKNLKTSSWNGDNASGFTALPGGYRNANGSVYGLSSSGYWWSTKDSGSKAWRRNLYNTIDGVSRETYKKDAGFSVRCVQD